MCSAFLRRVMTLGAAFVLSLSAPITGAAQKTQPVTALRICADPNNMPFSNRAGEGFENRIAELIARDLGRRVEYTWFPQRRGFFRNTLRAAGATW